MNRTRSVAFDEYVRSDASTAMHTSEVGGKSRGGDEAVGGRVNRI